MPPRALAVAALLGLAAFGLKRLAGLVVFLGILETVVLSAPPAADAPDGSTGGRGACRRLAGAGLLLRRHRGLGGGVTPPALPYLPELDLSDAADRLSYAAKPYHRGIAKRIIVTGGTVLSNLATATLEAVAMRAFLIDLGVPSEAIVSEVAALNTIENIRNVGTLVGENRVALVTSGFTCPARWGWRATPISMSARFRPIGARRRRRAHGGTTCFHWPPP